MQQTGKPLKPGAYRGLDEKLYHADPCETVSMAASMALTFIEGTPKHVWEGSRRLNPHWQDTRKEAFDIGDALHQRMLEGIDNVKVLDFADWRSKAAKEGREKAYADGTIPMLKHHDTRLRSMEGAVIDELTGHGVIDAWNAAEPEVTLIWERHGVMNRARIDKLDEKNRIAWDLKTSEELVDPYQWVRRAMNFGIDIRVAHYTDGLTTTLGPGWQYRLLCVEKKRPHCVSISQLPAGLVHMGAEKLVVARYMLEHCLQHDTWSGWAPGIASPEAPHFMETQWEERKARLAVPDEILKLAFEVGQ